MNSLGAAFPTVAALIGLIRKFFGSDPFRPLGAGAALLSILLGAAVGHWLDWEFSFKWVPLLWAPGRFPIHLLPAIGLIYLLPAFGLVGLAMAWIGWRILGGILMALAATAYAVGFVVLMAYIVIFFAPLAALAGALWMGAALSAWDRSAVPPK